MKNLTLQQLAEKLNGKYWEKGDKKRVYLDRGHNTKKMKTTTYVCRLDNGEFKACCYIDCPSQNWNWIESQQNEIIESVSSEIERIVEESESDNVFVIVTGDLYVDEDDNEITIDMLSDDEIFFTEKKAEKRLESCNLTEAVIAKVGKDIFFKLQSDAEAKAREKRESGKKQSLKPVFKKPEPKVKEDVNYEVGKKYNHSRFGVGLVKEKDSNNIIVSFECEEKRLLARFANMTLSE